MPGATILTNTRPTPTKDLGLQTRHKHGGADGRAPAPSDNQDGGPSVECVSDAEITQLVSLALEGAMISLGEASPETSLRLRACKARQDIRAAFESLPRVQTTDPTVAEEYQKAIVFQNLTLDLALKLVDTIRRYARLYELEIARSSA